MNSAYDLATTTLVGALGGACFGLAGGLLLAAADWLIEGSTELFDDLHVAALIGAVVGGLVVLLTALGVPIL